MAGIVTFHPQVPFPPPDSGPCRICGKTSLAVQLWDYEDHKSRCMSTGLCWDCIQNALAALHQVAGANYCPPPKDPERPCEKCGLYPDGATITINDRMFCADCFEDGAHG